MWTSMGSLRSKMRGFAPGSSQFEIPLGLLVVLSVGIHDYDLCVLVVRRLGISILD